MKPMLLKKALVATVLGGGAYAMLLVQISHHEKLLNQQTAVVRTEEARQTQLAATITAQRTAMKQLELSLQQIDQKSKATQKQTQDIKTQIKKLQQSIALSAANRAKLAAALRAKSSTSSSSSVSVPTVNIPSSSPPPVQAVSRGSGA